MSLPCRSDRPASAAMGVAYNSGLDVTIGEPDVGPMQMQGPKSTDVLVDLFGDSVLDVPYYYLRDYEPKGIDVVVSRTGLHVRDRLRDLLQRREPQRRKVVGDRARGRQAARPRGDRALPHPPHRGRHPRLRSRHGGAEDPAPCASYELGGAVSRARTMPRRLLDRGSLTISVTAT